MFLRFAVNNSRITLLTASLLLGLSSIGVASPCQKAPSDRTSTKAKLDSPLLWTLTDEIGPEDLFVALHDVKAHQERFREALAAGVIDLQGGPRPDQVTYFVSGRMTPELIPLWEAFDALSMGLHAWPDKEDVYRAQMLEHGLSEAGIGVVLARVHGHDSGAFALTQELKHKQLAWVDLGRAAKKSLSESEFRLIVESEDVGELSRATGEPKARVAELKAAAQRDPREESAVEHLPALRRELDLRDWNAFREFLRSEIASGMSGVERD